MQARVVPQPVASGHCIPRLLYAVRNARSRVSDLDRARQVDFSRITAEEDEWWPQTEKDDQVFPDRDS